MTEVLSLREHLSTGPAKNFVAGFMVDDRDRVVLIRKNRPESLAGKLNGPGGKVEPGESLAAAMRRKFREETGIFEVGWQPFLKYQWGGSYIWFYRSFVTADVVDQAVTCTDETVEVWQIGDLLQPGTPIVPNLRWLVPLAAHRHDRYLMLNVVEVG